MDDVYVFQVTNGHAFDTSILPDPRTDAVEFMRAVRDQYVAALDGTMKKLQEELVTLAKVGRTAGLWDMLNGVNGAIAKSKLDSALDGRVDGDEEEDL